MRKVKELKNEKGIARVFFNEAYVEYMVCFYNIDGSHVVDNDYFTDDKNDAIITAENQLETLDASKTDLFIKDLNVGDRIEFRGLDNSTMNDVKVSRVIRNVCRCSKTKRAYVVVKYNRNEFHKVYAEDIIRDETEEKLDRIASRTFDGKTLDKVVVDHSGFKTFMDLVDAKGGYWPTIKVDIMEKEFLADCYDAYQETRGDCRRANRYGTPPDADDVTFEPDDQDDESPVNDDLVGRKISFVRNGYPFTLKVVSILSNTDGEFACVNAPGGFETWNVPAKHIDAIVDDDHNPLAGLYVTCDCGTPVTADDFGLTWSKTCHFCGAFLCAFDNGKGTLSVRIEPKKVAS